MSNTVRTFEDLECWKACRTLRLFIAKTVKPVLPKEERFGLTAQILDAARSTTANIAEGYGRFIIWITQNSAVTHAVQHGRCSII